MKYSTTFYMFILIVFYMSVSHFADIKVWLFDMIMFSAIILLVTASYDEKINRIKELESNKKI